MLLARQGIEMSGFDLVHQLYWFAFSGNQVKPAPGHHQARRQAQHTVGDGIAMMMIVEKPRVHVAFAQRRLNGSQIHGQTLIVNKSQGLGESPRALPESGWRENGSGGGRPGLSAERSSTAPTAALCRSLFCYTPSIVTFRPMSAITEPPR